MLKPNGDPYVFFLYCLQQVFIAQTLEVDPGAWDRVKEAKRMRDEHWKRVKAGMKKPTFTVIPGGKDSRSS